MALREKWIFLSERFDNIPTPFQEYNDLVKRELLGERGQVQFLTADGVKFAHPLHHLGKGKEDLPLIAVDSFRHMYLFPKYEDSRTPVSCQVLFTKGLGSQKT